MQFQFDMFSPSPKQLATGALIVAEAREWIGTPHGWQQMGKQVSCDCKGLLAGVAQHCGRPEGQSLEALARDYSVVNEARLLSGLVNLFDQIFLPTAIPGDIALMRVGGRNQHLALISEVSEGIPSKIIHCYAASPSEVIEASVGTATLESMKSFWRWRNVD